jgi:hypothetical protein
VWATPVAGKPPFVSASEPTSKASLPEASEASPGIEPGSVVELEMAQDGRNVLVKAAPARGMERSGARALQVAKLAKADALDAVLEKEVRNTGVGETLSVVRADVCILRVVGAEVLAVGHRVGEDLADARRQVRDLVEEHVQRSPGPWIDGVPVEQQAAGESALAGI